ncbi:hypothetical protein L9F63_021364 [Diploptera punctata]|uniref:Cytochrome c oxidase assembly factor 1 homolog n=1 Tax=Diploptera punctata TaxID=6984 RepID=A0AAD7ZPM5_DIPPU|nr:hypothetical protein L9F63_021364 [Diploptera punctata]
MVSTRTLARIAAYGGVIVASTGFYLHWKLQDNVKNEEFHREAMKILRNHSPSVMLLGEPIKAGNVDLGNRSINFCDGTNAKLEVPVSGPKNKGILYFWAVKDDIQQKWNVHRMELGLKNDPHKRLLVKDDNKKLSE